MLLALLLVFVSCSGKKAGEATTGSANSESSPGSTGAALGGSTKDLGSLVDRVVAQANQLPRTEFDPAALAEKLGKDPQAHFQWVRDHTWWAPYRGVLRGSKGVMLDRVGSNLDRAILLGDLLRQSGQEIRLAHADLPQDRARELLKKLPPTPAQRTVAATGAKDANADSGSQRVAGEASALASKQSEELLAMVKRAAGSRGDRDDLAAVSAMRDYWWVERKENGKWVAMDLLRLDSQAGTSPTASATTSVWTKKEAMPGVPDADWHTVQIRVVIERYATGETTESEVLQTTLRPAELLETPIMLVHVPKPWPDSLPSAATDPNALGNAAVNVRQWVPMLQIGEQVIAQSGFSDTGDLIDHPFGANRDIAGAGGAASMTGFADALGGGGAPASSLTAEWLDYEIHVPGEAPLRIRRPVFDVLGPTARSAKVADFDANTNDRLVERCQALLSTTGIFLQTSDLSSAFVTHLMTKGIAANKSAIEALSRERDKAKARVMATDILGRIETWGPLPVLALWRAKLNEQPRTSFIDKPNVLNYRVGAPAVNADRVAVQEMIDVASNPTGVIWGAGQGDFEVRLRQGVADTVAEMAALGGNFSTTENTAALFAKAGDSAEHGIVIRPHDADALHRLHWPEDATARLGADVQAGFIAVALREPISVDDRQRVGWWRIDPNSGAAIGVMDSGFNTAVAEKSETEVEVMQLRNALRNWLADNDARIQAANAKSRLPWGEMTASENELLAIRDTVVRVLRATAAAGF